MPGEHSAGAIIYNVSAGTKFFLLLQYRQGHWDFPRGHIERGESPQETARREIEEETGISDLRFIPAFRSKNRWVFSYKGTLINKDAVYFIARTETKAVKLSDEHRSYAWLDGPDALEKLTFGNTKKIFIEALDFLGTR
ncbi:MAG: NUDIX domain-containing protein [Patescibacteria group bacterium]